jgi:hypothetical protein
MQIAAHDSKKKIVAKAAYAPETFQKAAYDMHVHWQNRTVTEKETRNRNTDIAFRTVFRISKCFLRS